MNDYSEFPPINLFKKILRNGPQAALQFVDLWKIRPKSRRKIVIDRRDIKTHFMISPTIFKNNLLTLGREEIICFEETKDHFLINFIENA